MTEQKIYYQYAEDVLSGKITACRYVKQACHRFQDFLKRDDLDFREDKVDKVLNFCGKMIQFESPYEDQPLVLTPWQTFFIANIYGFYYKDTDERVCRHALLEVGRKAGKSTLCSVLALYHIIAEAQGKVEVDVVACTREQARILFNMACSFAQKIDPRQKWLRKTINKLKYRKNDSFFQCLASESKRLDGYGSQVFFLDEAAAQEDSQLYNVLASSQGARHNPLSILLTSANFQLHGPHYTEWRKAAIDILSGVVQNDSWFALIYTLDEGDDYRDEKVWQKSQPNLGITVKPNYLKNRILESKSIPSIEADTKTKDFNLYIQAADVWISDETIMNTFQKVDLQQLNGETCYGGLDLASVSDLTSFSLMFPPNKSRDYFPDKYIFYSRPYLPEEALTKSQNSEFYKKAKKAGHLFTTPDNATDYNYILRDLLQLDEQFSIDNIAYDPYNSTQFVINAQDEGLALEPFSQGLGNFNRVTKEFQRLILSNKVVIDGSVVTRFCFMNTEIKEDHNQNQKPVKSGGDKHKKIDVVISMLMALGVYLMAPNYAYNLDESEE